jgi:hypothetical protein
LLAGALASRSHNGLLIRFAGQFGATPQTGQLEKIIRAENPAFDPIPWYRRLGERLNQVCLLQIESRTPPEAGTGFLIAADTVMTCYHVVQEVINSTFAADAVRLHFDFKVTDDGFTLAKDSVYSLDSDNWLIDASPYSKYEAPSYQPDREPSPEELDYALLRVDGMPGEDPAGGPETKDPNTPQRGWIPLPKDDYAFEPDSWLPILGHPRGRRMQLAIDTQSVIGLNGSKTRLRYRTNAEPGSSGSPCFDMQWNLVAMHHLGGQAGPQGYNQGIPLSAIRSLWQKRADDNHIDPLNAAKLRQLLEN